MIALCCPHCRVALSIPDAAAALPVACTACGQSFAVGIPISAPGADWSEAPPAREPESLPLHLRFQNRQRVASKGIGVFPVMALIFALVVPFAIGAVLIVAADQHRANPTTNPSDDAPAVEYKSSGEDPAQLQRSDLETSLPPHKSPPAPPLFRGAKPLPKPLPRDNVSSPKPPPP